VKREQRLRAPTDFKRVRDQAARAWPHPLLVVYVAPNELERTRVGVTVSSRVGKAVVRNRVRRRLKEALRARYAMLRQGLDVLVLARASSADAPWLELCAALDTLLRRAQALKSEEAPAGV
jgi:ribonuclease P protein component